MKQCCHLMNGILFSFIQVSDIWLCFLCWKFQSLERTRRFSARRERGLGQNVTWIQHVMNKIIHVEQREITHKCRSRTFQNIWARFEYKDIAQLELVTCLGAYVLSLNLIYRVDINLPVSLGRNSLFQNIVICVLPIMYLSREGDGCYKWKRLL